MIPSPARSSTRQDAGARPRSWSKSRQGLAAGTALLVFPPVAWAEGATVAIPLEKLPALKKVGGWTLTSVRGQRILFVRASEDKLRAYGGRCTHQKCDVNYNTADTRIDCKCHGSKFDMKGEPLNGPATEPLPRYAAGIKDDKIVVKLK